MRKNILLHHFGPFYLLVEQMSFTLCSRLFISQINPTFLLNTSRSVFTPKGMVIALTICDHMHEKLSEFA